MVGGLLIIAFISWGVRVPFKLLIWFYCKYLVGGIYQEVFLFPALCGVQIFKVCFYDSLNFRDVCYYVALRF